MKYKDYELQIHQSGVVVFDDGKWIEFPTEEEAKKWIDEKEE